MKNDMGGACSMHGVGGVGGEMHKCFGGKHEGGKAGRKNLHGRIITKYF